MYTAQNACEKSGYIPDVTLNPGNVNYSVAFDGLYELLKRFEAMSYVVSDAGYKVYISSRLDSCH